MLSVDVHGFPCCAKQNEPTLTQSFPRVWRASPQTTVSPSPSVCGWAGSALMLVIQDLSIRKRLGDKRGTFDSNIISTRISTLSIPENHAAAYSAFQAHEEKEHG